ncbi:MAG: MbcA/ParS/Xre antitoxin family protein [Stagnimonas sp.]|nr:MbcA/ParS/Xre antitoxin family protein [Stagnimonas sp.]
MSRNELGDDAALLSLTGRLMDLWNLDAEQRAAVLASGSPSPRLESQSDALPTVTSDQRIRFGHLLGIHQHLRLLFPQNPELAHRWITSPNKAFDNLTPVDIISRNGVIGLATVRAYLESYLAFRTM